MPYPQESRRGPEVTIDFPGEEERVTSNTYTFRVGTRPQADLVEVSVDGGPWQRCRPASGYFWFDWVCFDPGEHILSARAWAPDGAVGVSKPRRFRRA